MYIPDPKFRVGHLVIQLHPGNKRPYKLWDIVGMWWSPPNGWVYSCREAACDTGDVVSLTSEQLLSVYDLYHILNDEEALDLHSSITDAP